MERQSPDANHAVSPPVKTSFEGKKLEKLQDRNAAKPDIGTLFQFVSHSVQSYE
jgi:hypothetical protein